jgi:hypothetical protein
MNIIEALADCIMRFEGWNAPNSIIYPKGSTSWRNRNPGNLRDSIFKIGEDDKGYAIFPSFSSGWSSLTHDISLKLNCLSIHKLTAQSTLHDLFSIYAPAIDNNDPQHYSKIIAGWLNIIYNTNLITPDTKLGDLVKLK